jgi:hypothetical protein
LGSLGSAAWFVFELALPAFVPVPVVPERPEGFLLPDIPEFVFVPLELPGAAEPLLFPPVLPALEPPLDPAPLPPPPAPPPPPPPPPPWASAAVLRASADMNTTGNSLALDMAISITLREQRAIRLDVPTNNALRLRP